MIVFLVFLVGYQVWDVLGLYDRIPGILGRIALGMFAYRLLLLELHDGMIGSIGMIAWLRCWHISCS